MARQKLETVEQNFVGGLITEATEIAFPPNACTLTENADHNSNGRVSRRLGIDYEVDFTTHTDEGEERVIAGYSWYNVLGDGSVSMRVQQVGKTLHFWKMVPNSPVSSNKVGDTIDLDTYAATVDVSPELNECCFASADGRLIVTHPQCEPFYVKYNEATDDFTVTEIVVQKRDTVGLDSGLASVTTRPTASKAGLSNEHYYNLLNQGWGEDSEAHLDAWDTARTDMPSNADVWWFYRATSLAFDTAQIGNESIGNRPAPKGHFIVDIHNIDYSTVSGVSGIDAVTTGTSRVSKCCFFHNRVFYSGLNSTGVTSNVYVSRIIESDDDLGQCYQRNDPTVEGDFSLTDADGGVISILGLETVVKLWPLNNAVLVFATNGIWAISGSEGIGYRPNDFTVRKISSLYSNNEYNFVDVDGFPMWWNAEGIYYMRVAEGGGFDIQSITDSTIKTKYQGIPYTSKVTAKGCYDPTEKRIQWLYRSTAAETLEESYEYDRVLLINVVTSAWYEWIPGTSVMLNDIFLVRGEGGDGALDPVTTTEEFELQSFTGEVITASSSLTGAQLPSVRYYCSITNTGDDTKSDYTFAQERDTDYMDWAGTNNAEDFTTTIRTGYRIDGQLQSNIQANYVYVYLEQETDASCLMRGLWDFTNSASSNRWSASQQLYNSDKLYRDVNYRKLKVRGKGPALQLQFTSETGKPFTLLGWAINIMRNEGP